MNDYFLRLSHFNCALLLTMCYLLPCFVMKGNKWFHNSLVRLRHLSILFNDLSNRVSFRWTCFETCCMVRNCIVATLLLSQTKCINFKNVVYWNANIFPFESSSASWNKVQCRNQSAWVSLNPNLIRLTWNTASKLGLFVMV